MLNGKCYFEVLYFKMKLIEKYTPHTGVYFVLPFIKIGQHKCIMCCTSDFKQFEYKKVS